MMDENSDEYVIYNGEKIFVKEGWLELPYQVKSLGEIKGLEDLQSLKYLAYSGPYINKIESLETITHLEELYFNWGGIKKIENFEGLKNLRVLDLNANY